QISVLSGARGHLIGEVKAYLQIIAGFSLFWCGSIYMDMGVRAMGKPRLSMLVTLLASLINISCDLLFVGVFHWGIRGAALGTGIGFVVSFAILLRQYYLPQARLRFQRFKFRGRIILKIMANGSSEALTQLSVGITTLLFNLVLMGRIGESGVAAFSIILYLHELLIAITIGIASAIIPIVSYNYGAQKPRRVLRVLSLALKAGFSIGLLTTATIYLAGDSLARIFSHEPDLIRLTASALRLFAPCYLFIGINIIASSYFTAMEDAVRSALISVQRSLIFILLGLWALPLFFGNNGIWMTIPAAELLTVLCSVPMLIYSRRRLRRQAQGL
ncbi:MAG: MATE family efflux transporter, partial [Syntrophomonadaceae bacterium]|nr:MATE family efflux transporter [Syntrophomonadaceae bacterium]